jgi:hypothetical protein
MSAASAAWARLRTALCTGPAAAAVPSNMCMSAASSSGCSTRDGCRPARRARCAQGPAGCAPLTGRWFSGGRSLQLTQLLPLLAAQAARAAAGAGPLPLLQQRRPAARSIAPPPIPQVCKHPYSFTPVYADNAPQHLPWHELLAALCARCARGVRLAHRVSRRQRRPPPPPPGVLARFTGGGSSMGRGAMGRGVRPGLARNAPLEAASTAPPSPRAGLKDRASALTPRAALNPPGPAAGVGRVVLLAAAGAVADVPRLAAGVPAVAQRRAAPAARALLPARRGNRLRAGGCGAGGATDCEHLDGGPPGPAAGALSRAGPPAGAGPGGLLPLQCSASSRLQPARVRLRHRSLPSAFKPPPALHPTPPHPTHRAPCCPS